MLVQDQDIFLSLLASHLILGESVRNARTIAKICAKIAFSKRADDIAVLDLRELTDVTDYIVIASVNSSQQGSAILDAIKKDLKQDGWLTAGREGKRDNSWILLDFIEVIVHVFEHETRSFYDLENLWGDAPRVNWEDDDEQDYSESQPDSI